MRAEPELDSLVSALGLQSGLRAFGSGELGLQESLCTRMRASGETPLEFTMRG
jgi:hypothetical protein